MHPFFNAVTAFLATLFCILILRPVAHRVGLVDRPDQYRKTHQINTPAIGGLAIFFGFTIASLMMDYSLAPYRSLYIASALLVLMGLADDFQELSPKLRIGGQLFAALVIVFWGNDRLVQLGNILFVGEIHLRHCSILVSILGTVGLINAMNMLDGQDGLAGGVAWIQFAMLAYLAFALGNGVDFYLLLILLGTMTAFLFFNLPLPGRGALIFLGDAGSTLVGLLFAWFTMQLSQGVHAAPPSVFIWVMILPLFDIVATILNRLLRKQSPFKPDRNHIHHQLSRLGFSVLSINAILYGVSLLGGLVGLWGYLYHIPPGYLFIGFLFLFVLYFVFQKTLPRQGLQ